MAQTTAGNPQAGQGTSSQSPGSQLLRFLTLLVQLALIVFVIRQFSVESDTFFLVVLVTFSGFVLHYFLPMPLRLPFFVLLSFAAIGMVLGATLGAWLVGVGLLLIGLCHLPISHAARVTLLLLVAGLLTVMRLDWIPTPWSPALWAILGSMFMFRLIVYLYDLHHDETPGSVWRTLAYFFLLPNLCFMLFPVVDFKTFRRSYYKGDPHGIYQQGVDWMVRGLIQLLLYRLVYYHLVMPIAEVVTIRDLLRYMAANFLLYLRVSGQFHLVIGMLHLFGFGLPETNQRYFLASSFTDFWRRINIYWKDFMLKVFYYPSYFTLRTWGTTQAIVASTIVVFVTTWLLHSYQWLWLRGAFLLSWQDVLFWSILGSVMIANSLYEAKHPQRSITGASGRSWSAFVWLAFRRAATFSFICVLWSMWTAESLPAWVSLWTIPSEAPVDSLIWTLVAALAVLVGLMMVGDLIWRGPAKAGGGGNVARWPRAAAATIGALLIVAILGQERVYARLGSNTAAVIHSLQSGTLNRVDAARHQRGYYEELLLVGFNTQLWEVYLEKPLEWVGFAGMGLSRPTGDFLLDELVPLATTSTYGVTTRINRWGMRDRDYEQRPVDGAYRMAVLGASPVMGLGVEDGQTFEALVEERLNGERGGSPFGNYELLNFGVGGYRPLQQLEVLKKAWQFEPCSVLYVATRKEVDESIRHLVEALLSRVEIPYEYLRETARRAGIDEGTVETVGIRRLFPYRDEVLSWSYRQVVEECRRRGVVPLWMYLEMPGEGDARETENGLIQRAREAGFVVLPMGDVYRGVDATAISLAKWDDHPNAKAQALLAVRLHDALAEQADVVFHCPSGRELAVGQSAEAASR